MSEFASLRRRRDVRQLGPLYIYFYTRREQEQAILLEVRSGIGIIVTTAVVRGHHVDGMWHACGQHVDISMWQTVHITLHLPPPLF